MAGVIFKASPSWSWLGFSQPTFFKRFLSKRPNFGKYDMVKVGRVSPRMKVPPEIPKPNYWRIGLVENPLPYPEIKTAEQIDRLSEACQLASKILDHVTPIIKCGVTTDEIDKFVHNMCLENRAYPSPLNYKMFPKSVCTSVNNVACHGIPDNRPLVDGDMLNVDVTVYLNGMHGDSSRMYYVGEVDREGVRLSEVCRQALNEAIDVCRPGESFSTIGKVIELVAVENGFSVIPCFTGHGIGEYFHGPPDIYHFENELYQGEMETGMTFTIEPVLGQGSGEVVILEDGWTAVTEDGSRTAQWEHTVLITEDGAKPLTS